MDKQNKVQVRWTLVWVMLISAGLIGILTFIYTKEYVALIGSASSLLGGIGGVIKQLISPDKPKPDPLVNEGMVSPRGLERILVAVFGTITQPVAGQGAVLAPPVQFRKNLIIVLVIGSAFIVFLAAVFNAAEIDAAVAIIALANGLIGYGVGSMLIIVTPAEPEPDPIEDEGSLTPRGFERVIMVFRRLKIAQQVTIEPKQRE